MDIYIALLYSIYKGPDRKITERKITERKIANQNDKRNEENEWSQEKKLRRES